MPRVHRCKIDGEKKGRGERKKEKREKKEKKSIYASNAFSRLKDRKKVEKLLYRIEDRRRRWSVRLSVDYLRGQRHEAFHRLGDAMSAHAMCVTGVQTGVRKDTRWNDALDSMQFISRSFSRQNILRKNDECCMSVASIYHCETRRVPLRSSTSNVGHLVLFVLFLLLLLLLLLLLSTDLSIRFRPWQRASPSRENTIHHSFLPNRRYRSMNTRSSRLCDSTTP